MAELAIRQAELRDVHERLRQILRKGVPGAAYMDHDGRIYLMAAENRKREEEMRKKGAVLVGVYYGRLLWRDFRDDVVSTLHALEAA